MAAGSLTRDTYGLGETIVITVIAGEPVTVQGGVPILADRPRRSAGNLRCHAQQGECCIRYTVQASDLDTDGIETGDHTQTFLLDEDDRIFTTSQNIDIDRTHPAFVSDHKVDGSLTPAVTVPPRPTRPTLASATDTTLTIEWTHPGDGGSPPLLLNAVRYRMLDDTAWTDPDVGTTPVTHAVITNLYVVRSTSRSEPARGLMGYVFKTRRPPRRRDHNHHCGGRRRHRRRATWWGIHPEAHSFQSHWGEV